MLTKDGGIPSPIKIVVYTWDGMSLGKGSKTSSIVKACSIFRLTEPNLKSSNRESLKTPDHPALTLKASALINKT